MVLLAIEDHSQLLWWLRWSCGCLTGSQTFFIFKIVMGGKESQESKKGESAHLRMVSVFQSSSGHGFTWLSLIRWLVETILLNIGVEGFKAWVSRLSKKKKLGSVG